jgi:spore coat protein U-like protein
MRNPRLASLLLAGAGAAALSAPAAAQEKFVKIGNLTDFNFGLVTNLSADRSLASSICVYSAKATPGYNVRASGSGAGAAFTLAGPGSTLGYEVQWSARPGQATGTRLTPNVVLSGLVTTAGQVNCNSGPPTSASLIVLLRAASLQAALSGSYTGTLTVIVGSE